MAQAQHGSAPDIQGQNKANPISLIVSAAMLISSMPSAPDTTAARCAPSLTSAPGVRKAWTAFRVLSEARTLRTTSSV